MENNIGEIGALSTNYISSIENSMATGTFTIYESKGLVDLVKSSLAESAKLEYANTPLDTWKKRFESISVNVKDFGAIGDGIVNDTFAIQSAIDYVGVNGGGSIYIPNGIYMIDSTTQRVVNCGLLITQNNTDIILESGAVLKVIPNAFNSYNYLVCFYRMSHGSISGGTLEGDRIEHDYTLTGTHEFGMGVVTDGAVHIVIEKINIKNFTGDGIFVYGTNNGESGYIKSQYITIRNNIVDMSRRNNIAVCVGTDITIKNNIILNAGVNDGINDGTEPKAGIDIEGGSNPWRITISKNTFHNNLGGSVIVYNGNEVIVDGNTSDNFIGFQLSSNVLISNNQLRRLEASTHAAIEQTTMTASISGSGVMLAVGSKYIINSQSTLNFTTVGAVNNDVGTIFIATAPGPLGVGDSATRQLENVFIVGNIITGFKNGIGSYGITRKIVVSSNTLRGQETNGINVERNTDVIGNSLYSQSIAIRANGENNNILGNVIDGATSRGIYCLGANGSGTIKGNNLVNVSCGITTSVVDISAGIGWVIDNNFILGIGLPANAIFNNASGTVILDNKISNGNYGTSVIRTSKSAKIIGNKIINVNAPAGIFSNTANASNSLIAQNYIELSSTSGKRYGIIFTGGGTGVKITNNEIHNSASSMTNSINTSANTTSLIARNLITSGTLLTNATDVLLENLVI